MKKTVTLVFTVLLAFTVIACGSNGPDEPGIPEVTVTGEQSSTDDTTESTETAPATDSTTEETNEALPPEDAGLLFPDRYPIAFMVNNVAAARPQSGLDKAKLIYQLMTEGRTTRLLLLTDAQEGIIGPIRSARPAYLDLVAQHQAFYSHAGNQKVITASPVKANIKSLDALDGHYSMYYRTEHRKSPHNLYTTMEKAYARAEKTFGEITPQQQLDGLYVHAGFTLPDEGEQVTRIDYKFSSLKEAFQYDAKKNVYYKYNDDKILKDEQSKENLEVANIIILHRPHGLMPNNVHTKVDWLGENVAATYLTGGQKYDITWDKASHTDPIVYYLNGEELVLNPGLTWVVVVDDRALNTIEYE
ncbi:MAG TPA: DUF3048 domain-containing protein [Clostridiaceae bacterium]|nr:DUF3048 domain-containing protein [Clostridiaceae bacterium]